MWVSKRALVPRRDGTGRQTTHRLFAVTARYAHLRVLVMLHCAAVAALPVWSTLTPALARPTQRHRHPRCCNRCLQ